MIRYNKQQLEAVLHENGPMLVLAGPGCGKTSVITGRLKNLIEIGVSPSSVLVVTFTRAAASEMKERFLRLKAENGSLVTFGTLHGFFYRILKTECRLSADSIISEEKKTALLRNILEDECSDAFLEEELAKNVSQEISYIKGNGIASRHFYSAVLPAEIFRAVYGQYRRWLQENRRLDFDDINTAAFQLLRENDAALQKWQRQYRHILIDEFQDINPLQYRIIRMLAEPDHNLFIVGDDDQSVYRFRGSDPSMMLDFPKLYPECRIVRLTENYRSTPQILSAASLVIAANKKRYPKDLFTENKNGAPVRVRLFGNVWQETETLSAEIRKAQEGGTALSDIAVLVRTNFGARAAIERLISDRIPFEAQQEVPCIFDHFIARDLLAYLNIAAGSGRREDYLRICNKPNRYIARAAFYEKQVRFEDLYIYYEDRPWMWERLDAFERDLKKLSALPPYGAIQYIRKVIGYDEYISGYALEQKLPAADLTELLEEIMESARPYRSLDSWKAHIEKYSREVKSGKGKKPEKNSVKISTLHGSKGREYDIVYILDVNEGVIPYRKAAQEMELEEERRLLYVGMTRARYRLSLFAVKERYEKKMQLSSFLERLQAED